VRVNDIERRERACMEYSVLQDQAYQAKSRSVPHSHNLYYFMGLPTRPVERAGRIDQPSHGTWQKNILVGGRMHFQQQHGPRAPSGNQQTWDGADHPMSPGSRSGVSTQFHTIGDALPLSATAQTANASLFPAVILVILKHSRLYAE